MEDQEGADRASRPYQQGPRDPPSILPESEEALVGICSYHTYILQGTGKC